MVLFLKTVFEFPCFLNLNHKSTTSKIDDRRCGRTAASYGAVRVRFSPTRSAGPLVEMVELCNGLEGRVGVFFCGLRCFCLWKPRRDINGDKDAGCVFWFPRIKAFTQTKCGPISGCKFSTQKKAFPFSHPQVGHFVTALDNDEMCFCCASSFSSRQERYLWVMGHKPLIAAKICRLVKNHRAKISTESTTRDLDMAAVFWSSSCPQSHSA